MIKDDFLRYKFLIVLNAVISLFGIIIVINNIDFSNYYIVIYSVFSILTMFFVILYSVNKKQIFDRLFLMLFEYSCLLTHFITLIYICFNDFVLTSFIKDLICLFLLGELVFNNKLNNKQSIILCFILFIIEIVTFIYLFPLIADESLISQKIVLTIISILHLFVVYIKFKRKSFSI